MLGQGLNLLWASRQSFSFSNLNSTHFLHCFQWEFGCDESLFFGCFHDFSVFHDSLILVCCVVNLWVFFFITFSRASEFLKIVILLYLFFIHIYWLLTVVFYRFLWVNFSSFIWFSVQNFKLSDSFCLFISALESIYWVFYFYHFSSSSFFPEDSASYIIGYPGTHSFPVCVDPEILL